MSSFTLFLPALACSRAQSTLPYLILNEKGEIIFKDFRRKENASIHFEEKPVWLIVLHESYRGHRYVRMIPIVFNPVHKIFEPIFVHTVSIDDTDDYIKLIKDYNFPKETEELLIKWLSSKIGAFNVVGDM